MPETRAQRRARLRAAIKKNTRRIKRTRRKIKRHQRLVQTWRKWRARQQRDLKRLQQPTGPEAMVKFALPFVGKTETSFNRAPWLDAWVETFGEAWMRAQPYCGLGVWRCALAAGKTLTKETVSTVAIRNHAIAGTGGYKAWHSASTSPKLGWVAIYGTGGPQHTGFYIGDGKVWEANTSPGASGSQNNGEGVYIRTLAERRGWLLGWAEIDWS